jgi:hypothetical protein
MAFRSYLTVMGVTWLIAALAVMGFNLLVDAIGISPLRIAIAGFNAAKPLRQEHDWIVKRYDVWRYRPTTIFMGSSRIKQTIDPKLAAGTTFAPAYNAGINDSANFAEVKAYLQYYLQTDKNLRHVFIEAFAMALLQHRELRPKRRVPAKGGPTVRAEVDRDTDLETPAKTRPQRVEFGLAGDIADLASVFFSVGGVSSAVRTVAVNRERGIATSQPDDDGFAPVALAPHHFSVRNVFNFVLHTAFMQRGGSLAPVTIAAAKEMIEDCQHYRVQCYFFVSPLHADVLYAAYYLGLWPELEKLKRALAELAPTYDFTRYNDLIDERIGPVLYWPEAFHFAPALGELMTKAMLGMRTATMPANFGVVIDRDNIDASLAAWREERDRWIAEHPDSVVRMQKAEENFRQGRSFKTVTDAEIAAGGW